MKINPPPIFFLLKQIEAYRLTILTLNDSSILRKVQLLSVKPVCHQ